MKIEKLGNEYIEKYSPACCFEAWSKEKKIVEKCGKPALYGCEGKGVKKSERFLCEDCAKEFMPIRSAK